LANRKLVYKTAKLANPMSWSGGIRNWDHIEEVYLDPEKGKSEVKESKAGQNTVRFLFTTFVIVAKLFLAA
jgi:hypothetical protein